MHNPGTGINRETFGRYLRLAKPANLTARLEEGRKANHPLDAGKSSGQRSQCAEAAALVLVNVQSHREFEIVSRQHDILKQCLGQASQTAELCEVIAEMKTERSSYSTAEMCLARERVAAVCSIDALKHQGDRQLEEAALAEQISVIFLQSRQTYGSRRIQQMLWRGPTMCLTC